MLDQLRNLWAERPAVVVAAVIAPIAFVVTLLILFLAVGDTGDDAQQPLVAQQAQSEEPAAQTQTTVSQGTTVVVETSTGADQQQAVAQSSAPPASQEAAQHSSQDSQTRQSAAQQADSEPPASDPEQQAAEQAAEPLIVAGHVVESLDAVLVQQIDEEALRHGTDGSEGGILPLDNGVVRSSGPDYETTWELIVPSAGLKSAIVKVGRTRSGAMGSPDNPYVIGWLDSSAEPGAAGNTLLAGHRDFEDRDGNIGTGVCWELVNTVEGDQMIVVDNENSIYYVYTVTEASTVNPRDPDSARYLKNTDESVVTLITCEGSFNAETHQYSHRRVVVGVLAAVASPDA